mmetsp:Transcript_35229/g.114054  ORF Transcript_35229/g.114054 Transcript_35229/m.114054 type:complete len:123 (+) Transcript_35229:1845-2213(+)
MPGASKEGASGLKVGGRGDRGDRGEDMPASFGFHAPNPSPPSPFGHAASAEPTSDATGDWTLLVLLGEFGGVSCLWGCGTPRGGWGMPVPFLTFAVPLENAGDELPLRPQLRGAPMDGGSPD